MSHNIKGHRVDVSSKRAWSFYEAAVSLAFECVNFLYDFCCGWGSCSLLMDGRVEMYKGNNFKALALTAGFSDTSFTTYLVVFSIVIFQYKSYKGRVRDHL